MKFKKLSLLIVGAPLFLVAFFACTKTVESTPSFVFKPAPSQGMAARLNGVVVSDADLIKGIESELYEAQMKVFEIKMARLKAIVLERLMKADPRKKELSNDDFLNKYIAAGVGASAKDIEAFIVERKIPAEHINDQMKDRIKKYLEVELKRKAVDSWITAQTAKSPVEVFFAEPARPVFKVSVGDAPIIGGATAKVEVIEFSDFQCPHCATGSKRIAELKKKYGNKIKIAFKNFPLPFHNHAQLAAEAALCAEEIQKGNFWKLHDVMFGDQSKLSKADLLASAEKLGFDKAKFSTCLDSRKFTAKVKKDEAEGKEIGVKSTPTFFVNGKMINGAQDIAVFSKLIDEELKK